MPAALVFASLFKCAENSESDERDGCTATIVSLDRYAIRATIEKLKTMVAVGRLDALIGGGVNA